MNKIVFLRIWYIQVSILLENLYPVRDRPFDFQCGWGLGFFLKKNSLFPYWRKKQFLLIATQIAFCKAVTAMQFS